MIHSKKASEGERDATYTKLLSRHRVGCVGGVWWVRQRRVQVALVHVGARGILGPPHLQTQPTQQKHTHMA